MRISLDLLEGDRLEGRIVSDDSEAERTFSGTLDLLRAIEELRAVTNTPSETRKEGSSCR